MYEAKDFKRLIGVNGLSEKLLTNHFTLYDGYVKNTNSMLELLDNPELGQLEYSEVQRRFGWEWNGMRLHELYFGNLDSKQSELSKEGQLTKELQKIYGSLENWRENFIKVGKMRGIGWVILYYDHSANEFFNAWVNEHDQGHFAGASPLLVLDVFEHAYMLDYGTKRDGYIDAFFNLINWQVVEERFRKAKEFQEG